jgi:hypothetical protein
MNGGSSTHWSFFLKRQAKVLPIPLIKKIVATAITGNLTKIDTSYESKHLKTQEFMSNRTVYALKVLLQQ